jgi:hypothetical protein
LKCTRQWRHVSVRQGGGRSSEQSVAVDLQESGDILETDEEGVGGQSKGVHEYFPESDDVLRPKRREQEQSGRVHLNLLESGDVSHVTVGQGGCRRLEQSGGVH